MYEFKLNGIRQQLRSDVNSSDAILTIDASSISQSCDGEGLVCGFVTCENGMLWLNHKARVLLLHLYKISTLLEGGIGVAILSRMYNFP